MKAVLAILAIVAIASILYLQFHQPKGVTIWKDEERLEGEETLIGVISDTHIPARASELPPQIFELFKDADLIIHAGDLVTLDVISELETIAPVIAVRGNMDSGEDLGKLPEMQVTDVKGWRIGVRHDSLSPLKMRKMKKVAEENGLDVLVFGHTHRAFLKVDNNVLYLNPGSPTQPLLSKPSVALLRISNSSVESEIVHLE